MKNYIITVFLLFSSIFLYAQKGATVPIQTPAPPAAAPAKPKPVATKSNNSSASKLVTLIVYPETVPCTDNSNAQCLQIRREGSSKSETVLDIENFNYDFGYIYTIQVKETTKTNSAGESASRFVWVKTINQQEDGFNATPTYTPEQNQPDVTVEVSKNQNGKLIGKSDIFSGSKLDGKWYLRKMKETEGSSFVMDDNTIWIEINTFKDRLDGFGACNNFGAVVKSDRETTFELSKLTADLNFNCGVKKIEKMFFDLLQQADRFEIKNGNLILSKQWKYLLAFTLNPDNKEDIITTYMPETIIQKNNSAYATDDESLKPEETPITSYRNTSSSTTTTTTSFYTPSASSVNDAEIEAKNREIEELKRQLAAQSQEDELKKKAQIKAQQDTEIAALKKQLEEKQLKDSQQQKEAQLKAQKDAEMAALKKQLEEKQLKDAQQQKEAQLKTQKDAEIAALKKQLEEKNQEKPVAQNSYSTKKTSNIEEVTNYNTTTANDDNTVSGYAITTFVKNKSNNIPEPEFTLQPFYLDGNELVRLERSKANFTIKQKGIYRGQDLQFQVMQKESPIQFVKGNLPRFFISIADEDTDPHDIIDLCKADKIGAGRRNFTYAGRTYGGRVKDVTGKLADLEFKKIRKGLYEILIESELEQGEYAFIPMFKGDQNLSSTNSIKASCFGIVDPGK